MDDSNATPREALGETERSVRWRPPGWAHGRAAPIAAGVAGGLLIAQAATAVFLSLRGLLLIVIVSLFLSFALEPAVQWLNQRGVRRGIGTWIVFLGVLAALTGFVMAMAGLVADQVRTLIDTAPTLIANLSDQAELLPGELGEQVAAWLDEQQEQLPRRATGAAGLLGRGALDIGQTVIGGLFQLATIGLITFYLVADGPKLRFRLASRLSPAQQVRVLGVWELAISKTGGYVYSRVLTAIASAAFHVAVFSIIGLDYAIALGAWVGIISSLIPVVGTYIAGALPVVVALATSPTQALWVLVAITAYQQVENYYVVPRITASTLELHPAVAFLSVIAGGVLAGATGALLAIPAVAIGTALLSAASEEYEVLEHQLVVTGPKAARELVEELEAERAELRQAAGRRRAEERRRGRDRRRSAPARPTAQDLPPGGGDGPDDLPPDGGAAHDDIPPDGWDGPDDLAPGDGAAHDDSPPDGRDGPDEAPPERVGDVERGDVSRDRPGL